MAAEFKERVSFGLWSGRASPATHRRITDFERFLRLIYDEKLSDSQIAYFTKAFANGKYVTVAGRRLKIFNRQSDAFVSQIIRIADTRDDAAAQQAFSRLVAQPFYGKISGSFPSTKVYGMFMSADEADKDDKKSGDTDWPGPKAPGTDWPGPRWPGPRIER